jgi:hypothetical protein
VIKYLLALENVGWESDQINVYLHGFYYTFNVKAF